MGLDDVVKLGIAKWVREQVAVDDDAPRLGSALLPQSFILAPITADYDRGKRIGPPSFDTPFAHVESSTWLDPGCVPLYTALCSRWRADEDRRRRGRGEPGEDPDFVYFGNSDLARLVSLDGQGGAAKVSTRGSPSSSRTARSP